MTTAASSAQTVAGFDEGTPGVTPPSADIHKGAFLSDVIVELGFATQERMEELVESARQSGKALEPLLLDSGVLDEKQLSLAIAERTHLDHVDLEEFEVDLTAAKMVSRTAGLRHSAVPIAFGPEGTLIVALDDPFNSLAIEYLEMTTKRVVRPVIATAGGIRGLIERLAADSDEEASSDNAGDGPAEHDEHLHANGADPASNGAEAPETTSPESGVESAADPDQRQASSAEDVASLSTKLKELRETALNVEDLAVAAGRRLEELEGAQRRTQRPKQELLAARKRIADLERRLADVDAAAKEAIAVTKKLQAAHHVIEQSAGVAHR